MRRLQCSKAKSQVVKRLKNYSISDNLQKTNTCWSVFLPSSTFCSLFEVTVYVGLLRIHVHDSKREVGLLLVNGCIKRHS